MKSGVMFSAEKQKQKQDTLKYIVSKTEHYQQKVTKTAGEYGVWTCGWTFPLYKLVKHKKIDFPNSINKHNWTERWKKRQKYPENTPVDIFDHICSIYCGSFRALFL